MRMIGTVASEAHAQRFSDHLLTQKIDAHIEEGARGDWQVWVEHDDELDRAKEELTAFVQAPDDPRYDNARAIANRARRDKEKAAERRKRNYTDVRTSAAWTGLQRYSTPLAVILIFASVLVSVLSGFGDIHKPLTRWIVTEDNVLRMWVADEAGQPPPDDAVASYDRYGMFGRLAEGQVWRLVTPMFGHFDVFHLLFNMMWLWRLGQVIEGVKGSIKFGLLVLAVAVVSDLSQALWVMYIPWEDGFGFSLGMSGVNAGLFGYAWMKHKLQPYERIHVSNQELGMMLGWLVICSFGIVGPIANAAHWGGLVTGVLFGAAPYLKRRFLRR